MTVQWVAVAIIVPLCTLYAVWNLMGADARRRFLGWLAKGPWPAAWQRRLAERADARRQSIVRVHRPER